MTATNHAITGSVIALSINQPLLALPLAFASHFLLDALPHFGEPYEKHADGSIFWIMLAIDFVLFWSFAVFLLINIPSIGFVAFLGAAAASCPDVVWAYRFIVKEKLGKISPPKMNRFNKFHAAIQWGERPWGWIFELVWLIGISYVFLGLLP